MNHSIALVTPMKNEISNLFLLVSALSSQTLSPKTWILINDSSTDGSAEFINEKLPFVYNIENKVMINFTSDSDQYQLGGKYSRIIKFGFDELEKLEADIGKHDFVGILDADCIPVKDYYERLIQKFLKHPKLGIASGTIYNIKNNQKHIEVRPRRWARGGIRLWRRTCFDDAGYITGKSADAISSALAWSKGWQVRSYSDCLVASREVGHRTDYKYYGNSAYNLGIPETFIRIKSVLYNMTGRKQMGNGLIQGYLEAKKNNNRDQLPPEVIRYNKSLPIRIILESIISMTNN